MIRVHCGRLVVFSFTFASYALYHASRKTLSGVKSSLSDDWVNGTDHPPFFHDSKSAQTFLGSLDSLFMFCYAIALVFWGWLGDRLKINPLMVVAFGMVGSALTLTAFGSIPFWFNFYSVPWYLFTYALFGVVQACGWPNEVAIMANWFPKTNRGFIMGMWAACQPFGNILGALFISFVLPMGYDKTFAFNSLLILIGAILLLIFVRPKPPHSSEVSIPSSFESQPASGAVGGSANSSDDEGNAGTISNFNTISHQPSDSRPVAMCEALFLPSVLPYCLCTACLKFVNYAFFFWLPYYLTYKYQWAESEANQLSIWYDIGGIVGSVLGGLASDRLGHRSPIILLMLVLSVPLLFIYSGLGSSRVEHVIGMSLLGVTISGPYNLIVGTIAIDLGSQQALANNAEALSTVTGLIDGIGSAGSALGQLFVPLIQNELGWIWVFHFFILMNFLSSMCLIRRFFHDARLISLSFAPSQNDRRQENEPLISNN
ncbi:hypothetical protein niasHS_010676 [Heterodera schachtii]|uniref:Major facilitator superfamily (MFS) profile domain-containing protein n=1 Tax=Heterodera schachtii TaxID=97005 RepID=A0ABD2IS86_HETSC